MTEAVFGGTAGHCLRMTGHAGDFRVCAALSVLCCTLVQTLEQRGVPHTALLTSGGARIETAARDVRTGTAFAVTETGLRGLAAAYPRCVSVRREKTNGGGASGRKGECT